MWKFRRYHDLLNFSYVFGLSFNLDCVNFGVTQVAKAIKDVNFGCIAKNNKYPFNYNCQIPLFYSTSLNYSTPDANLAKLSCVNGENNCERSVHVDISGEDDDVHFGVVDEKLIHDVGVILDVLSGVRKKGNVSKGEPSSDKPVVISGVELTKKLDGCRVGVGSELVVEVLSRIRNDWEVAYAFFLWAGKQPGYVHLMREYHSMISIFAKRRKFDTCWFLIDEMKRAGIVTPNTLWIMVRRYCAAHDVVGALNTFHGFKRFDFDLGVEEFQKLLCALSRYKNAQDAEQLLFSNKNIFPFNTKSFNIVLNGWCNVVGSPREANRFWRLMIDLGIKLDVFSFSSMISSYSKSNRLKDVLRLFVKMKEMGIHPDRKVYNAVIHAYANGGHVKEALDLLGTMEEKEISPNAATYNSLIKPLCKARKREEAQKVLDKMLSCGLRPNIRTFHAFLLIQRTSEEILMLLDKMKELGCHPNKDTYLLLIRKFCRWRQLDNVFKLWDKMTENGWNDDEASYITLIHGLFLNGKLEEANTIYSEMKEKSLLPDAKTNELIQTWLSNKQMAES